MPPGDRRPAVFVALLLLVGVATPLAQDFANETRVKAAFLYQFPQFVEWPAGVLRDRMSVRLCLASHETMADELGRIVEGEDLSDRKFEVVVVHRGASIADCHLVFVRGDADGRALLRAAAGRPILTVADDVQAFARGAVIAFRVVDRRVRFEISTVNARRNGVRISSQLLALALAVHGGGE